MSLFHLTKDSLLSQTTRRLLHTSRRAEFTYNELVRAVTPPGANIHSLTSLVKEQNPELPEPVAVYATGPSRTREHFLQFASEDASFRYANYVNTNFTVNIAKASVASRPQIKSVSTDVVFVRELPNDPELTEESLNAYFSKYGPIQQLRVTTRGFHSTRQLFIKFEQRRSAEALVRQHLAEPLAISGQLLELDFSYIKMADVDKPAKWKLEHGYSWDRLVRIHRLPPNLKVADVEGALRERGFDPANCQILLRVDHDRNPGYVDISFRTSSDANLFLTECRAKPVLSRTLATGQVVHSPVSLGVPRNQIYPPSRVIVIPQLPDNFDERELFVYFRAVGPVARVKVLRPSPGKAFTSTAYIYFAMERDAMRVISAYGQMPLIINGTVVQPQTPPPRVRLDGDASLLMTVDRFPGTVAEVIETMGPWGQFAELSVQWTTSASTAFSGRFQFAKKTQAVEAAKLLNTYLKAWMLREQALAEPDQDPVTDELRTKFAQPKVRVKSKKPKVKAESIGEEVLVKLDETTTEVQSEPTGATQAL